MNAEALAWINWFYAVCTTQHDMIVALQQPDHVDVMSSHEGMYKNLMENMPVTIGGPWPHVGS